MYSGVANSPETYLKENVAPEGTTIYLNDTSVLGDLPTLAVIGTDQNAETVLVKSKRSDGGLEIQRAVEGLAKKWEKATVVARNFTNYDYKTLKENIELLNDDKVSKATGKGLSTNDFTTAEQTKLKGIEAGANKTIIVNDLTTGGTTKALSAEQGKMLFQNVDDGKLQIANAIIDKGQSGVSNNSSFQELATKIKGIKTGYGVGDVIKPADVKVLSHKEEKVTKIWEFTGHTGLVNTLAVDSQGYVYSGGNDKKVMKISPQGTKIWEFTGNINWVFALAIDSQGNIYSGSGDNKIMKISPQGQKIWEFTEHTSEVHGLAVDSQDNSYSCSYGRVIKISPQGQKIWEFTGYTEPIYALTVDNQDNIYAGGSGGKVMKISPQGQKIWELVGHTSSVTTVAVDSQGNVYSGSWDKKVMKISPNGTKIWEFTEHKDTVYALAVDSQGNIYSGSGDNKIMKISPQGQKIWEFTRSIWIKTVAVDSQGNIYSSGGSYNIAKLHQNIEQVITGYEVLR